MRLREITNSLEILAPLGLQESYDNSGLIIGDQEMEVRSALLSLDCTEAVVDEAIKKGCELIISHHPILFSGIKSLTGKTYVERTLLKAIRSNIAIYAIHTNLDNIQNGVNGLIANKLGLTKTKILHTGAGKLKKVVVFVPNDHAEAVRKSMFDAGGGQIGNYGDCSFNTSGEGTFLPLKGAQPFSGVVGERKNEAEIRIEMIVNATDAHKVIAAMIASHPYEEVAYDLYALENTHSGIGAGLIGELPKPMNFTDFLGFLKDKMKTKCIRHTPQLKEEVLRIAVCGGSGSFLIPSAIKAGADVFVTADMKYHQFFDAENKLVVADIGHYESEQFTPEILKAYMAEKFPTFATHFSEVQTNPVHYFV